MCPRPSLLGGTLPNTNSPISSRDEAGVEAAYQKEETMTILDGFGRVVEAESD
jgi:hypothetical protein